MALAQLLGKPDWGICCLFFFFFFSSVFLGDHQKFQCYFRLILYYYIILYRLILIILYYVYYVILKCFSSTCILMYLLRTYPCGLCVCPYSMFEKWLSCVALAVLSGPLGVNSQDTDCFSLAPLGFAAWGIEPWTPTRAPHLLYH